MFTPVVSVNHAHVVDKKLRHAYLNVQQTNNEYCILNIEYQMNGPPSLERRLQHARCLDYNLKTILQYVAILTLILVRT